MKRAFDLFLVLGSSIIWVPLLVVVAAAVAGSIGRPIFLVQNRPGALGRPFKLLKFRTMNMQRDCSGALLSDEQRLTRFGHWLRASSLDEVPELINVLKGEMSLVGPRPLLMQYLDRYTPRQARRHQVLPGITGWAQVNGRNAISWEEKLELDVWYVENQSLWLDVKILFVTCLKVFNREGINAPGCATVPEFRGSKTPNH